MTEHCLSNPMILAYESSAATGQAGAPVFGGVDLLELIGLAYVGEAFVDELPAAGDIGTHFAAIFPRAAAGAVEHVFGTACDGTDATEVGP